MKFLIILLAMISVTGCTDTYTECIHSVEVARTDPRIVPYGNVAEIYINDQLMLISAVELWASQNTVYLQDGATNDDAYNAMSISFNGVNWGCVHDYTGKSRRVTFGLCIPEWVESRVRDSIVDPEGNDLTITFPKSCKLRANKSVYSWIPRSDGSCVLADAADLFKPDVIDRPKSVKE